MKICVHNSSFEQKTAGIYPFGKFTCLYGRVIDDSRIILLFIFIIAGTLNLFAQSETFYDSKTNTYRIDINSGNTKLVNTNPMPPLFNWQMVKTSSIQIALNIYFVDSLFGWASHFEGVLKTTDGGLTWQDIDFNIGADFFGLNFINRDTGLVVGTCSTIKRTTNGGVSWSDIIIPFLCDELNEVQFFNASNCVMIGTRNGNYLVVFKSANGGVNWTQVYLSTTPGTRDFSHFWFNESTGWVCGYNTLLKTTNSGSNFTNYFPNILPTSNGTNALLGICFVNEQTGWISAGNIDQKNMYKTTNGGINWVFQDNPVAQYQFAQLDDVLFINENTGWAGAYVGQIITTTNGGLNWITDVSAPTWFTCFAEKYSTKVWCGARFGEIWYLNDLTPIGIQQTGTEIPAKFNLKQNYPNPFNWQTTIEFDVPRREKITVKIIDILGREIEEIVNRSFEAGTYKINYDAGRLSSGIYFYILKSESYKEIRKFILIK